LATPPAGAAIVERFGGRDDREVDCALAVRAEPGILGWRFIGNLAPPVIELAQPGRRFVDAHDALGDFLAERATLEVVPEPTQTLQPLLRELLFREQLVVLQVRIDDFTVDGVETAAPSALRTRRAAACVRDPSAGARARPQTSRCVAPRLRHTARS
jgi:hypothetical protein